MTWTRRTLLKLAMLAAVSVGPLGRRVLGQTTNWRIRPVRRADLPACVDAYEQTVAAGWFPEGTPASMSLREMGEWLLAVHERSFVVEWVPTGTVLACAAHHAWGPPGSDARYQTVEDKGPILQWYVSRLNLFPGEAARRRAFHVAVAAWMRILRRQGYDMATPIIHRTMLESVRRGYQDDAIEELGEHAGRLVTRIHAPKVVARADDSDVVDEMA